MVEWTMFFICAGLYLIVCYLIYRLTKKEVTNSNGVITKYGKIKYEYMMHCLKLVMYIVIGIFALLSLTTDIYNDVNLQLLVMIALIEVSDHALNIVIYQNEYRKAMKKVDESKKRC